MSAIDELCRSYLDVRWHFDPAAASRAGRTDQDGRLGRFDAESVREHLAAVRSLSGAAEELEVEEAAEEIDRTALLDDMRVLGFRFDYEQPHRRNPAFWLQHLRDAFTTRLLRDPDGSSAGAVADRLKDVAPFLDAAQGTLEKPAGIFVDTALAMLGGLGEVLVIAGQRYGALAPELTGDLDAATGDALTALKAFGLALSQKIVPSSDPLAFAAGEEQFERRLRFEHALLAGAPELWRHGLHLREEVEAEVVALAQRIDPSSAWRDVVLQAVANAPDTTAAVASARDEAARAIAFIEERRLATLPFAPLEMAVAASWQPGWIATYEPAPAYLPEQAARYTLPADARGRSTASLPVLVAHDLWPGRHLQALRSAAQSSETRQWIAPGITINGWALYAQGLMAEEGFYPSPESRLLHQVNLLYHATCIDIDIGLHTRGRTPAEAIEELVTRLPLERGQAEATVRRICECPTEALSHAVGRRAFLELREAARVQRGSAFDIGGFHDEVLACGGLPVSLIRWGMGIE